MSIFSFLGRATPRAIDQLERDVEDALEGGNAAWDVEHDALGHHGDVTATGLGSADGNPVEVSGGLRFTSGPWCFEADETESPGRAVLRPGSLTADQNDWAPDGIAAALVVEVESTAARTITGINVPLRRRRLLKLVNRGNFTITLKSNSASSISRNRLYFGGSDYPLLSGSVVDLYYDIGAPIWRGPSFMKQVRTAFHQKVLWSGSGAATQSFTFSKAVLSVDNTVIFPCAVGTYGVGGEAKTTTTFELAGLPIGGVGNTDVYVQVIEFLNLDV